MKCQWPECDKDAQVTMNLVYIGGVSSCEKHIDSFFDLNIKTREQRRDLHKN